jgi:3-hydroxyisobutyrate dehydrogenase
VPWRHRLLKITAFAAEATSVFPSAIASTIRAKACCLLLVIFAPHIISVAMQSRVAAGVAQALAAGSREIFLSIFATVPRRRFNHGGLRRRGIDWLAPVMAQHALATIRSGERCMSEKVAVIGMGQMGSGMAGRLKESGLDVVGYDINADQRARLASEGFQMAPGIAEALAGRTLVLTSLPDPKAVMEAWLGADGIVAHAAKGTLCIELSTIDPQTMRQVAEAAIARGLAVVDCPVSGSPNEARSGKLILIAGGEMADVTRAEPFLKLLGNDWKYTGGVGTAKVVKIVNNMMSMGNVLVAAEAFALGVAAGVEPDKLYDVLSVSGGRSHHFTKRFPNALKGDFSPGFKLELGEKDLALAVELGRATRMPTPSASATRELYALALAEGFRGQDIVSLLAMYQNWAKPAPSGGNK